MIKIGPTGGDGGRPLNDYLLPEGASLVEVRVFVEDYVHAVQFVYRTAAGEIVEMARFGGEGGDLHFFQLEDGEYLVGLNGRSGWFIDTINLHTNRRSSPEFGGIGGVLDYFLNAPSGYELVGLFGRGDWYLDALGVIARERTSGNFNPAGIPD